MAIIKRIWIYLLVALLVTLLVACSSQGTTLTGKDRDDVLAFSEAKTDNLLAGMNANGHTAFPGEQCGAGQ